MPDYSNTNRLVSFASIFGPTDLGLIYTELQRYIILTFIGMFACSSRQPRELFSIYDQTVFECRIHFPSH